GTVNAKKLATTAGAYQNKDAKVIKQGQISGRTYYQFQVNGKTVGWMDYRAFFDTITSQKTMNKTVTVGNATNHGV
ncbi:GW domain-containing glycosaminoglycan-binding protein, partial [Listeria monocytogenes]